MSLKEVKKLLNIDQQNILNCTVVQVFDEYLTVRTPSGKEVRAGKSGSGFVVGDSVEVRTDTKNYTVIGSTNYAQFSAERDFEL
jgi:hypothetical protein